MCVVSGNTTKKLAIKSIMLIIYIYTLPVQAIQQQSSESINEDPHKVAVKDYPPAVSQGVDSVSDGKLTKEAMSQQLKLTRAAIFAQIVRATNELEREQAVVTRTQLCSLVTTAMTSLKTLCDLEGSIRP